MNLKQIEKKARLEAEQAFQKARNAEDPTPQTVQEHVFAPTPITEEVGERTPKNQEKIVMVDAAIHAIQELMWKHPEAC